MAKLMAKPGQPEASTGPRPAVSSNWRPVQQVKMTRSATSGKRSTPHTGDLNEVFWPEILNELKFRHIN